RLAVRQAFRSGDACGRKLMRALLCAVLSAWFVTPVVAAERAAVDLCFNYGCSWSKAVFFSGEELDVVRSRLAGAEDAAAERVALGEAVALMYRLAGMNSPISADRAGNLADQGVHGRMDCIDHSTTTTAFLRIIEERGWLRFHEVSEVARRSWLMLSQHFGAVVDTKEGPGWVIESWFGGR